jgi:hypothetical protein
MAHTVFVNQQTLTDADWFNDLDRLHYEILGDPQSVEDVRVALGITEEPGPQGPPGPQGEQGPPGEDGIDGASGSSLGAHVSFTFNSNTTAPPIGNQLRLNQSTQSAATIMWVSQTTVEGLDVSAGLDRIKAGYQVYMQDYDDSSKWLLFNVTSDAVDSGSYFTITISFNRGSALPVPFQKIELQSISPGTIGIPAGGTTGQVLVKSSNADYDVEWADLAVLLAR